MQLSKDNLIPNVMMEDGSDKMWSTGERNGKLLQYSSLENPMNSIKKKSTKQVKREVNFDKENLIGLSGRNTLLK